MLNPPLLFLNYNRPHLTLQVLAAIRAARPSKLFVAADGPRSGKPGDYEKCQAVRNVLRDGIDWDCEVHTLLRDENVGCKAAVSSAVTWFFDNVEEGIILEDDTLPSPSFFPFCAELLERYRHTQEILHISGDNFQMGRMRGFNSYYFSIYNHNWGWATWRRAWQLYDVDMNRFPELRQDDSWQGIFQSTAERDYWLNMLRMTWEGKIDTWDFQWIFAVWINRGLSVLPNVNLVSNIGFRGDGTHNVSNISSPLAELPTGALGRLDHPLRIAADRRADRFTFSHVFENKPAPKISRLELLSNRIWSGFLKKSRGLISPSGGRTVSKII